jgi:uncharacterized membrane protein
MTQRFVKSLVRRSLDSDLLGRALHEVMPGFLVVIGAAFSFTALIADYFSSSANRFSFGRDQIILLTAGIAAMVAGAALDVLLRNRTLEQTLKFWLVAAQVALLAVAFQWYHLENVAFYEFVMLLTLFGFIANHYLPQPLRLPFFLFISFAAFAGVFSVYSAAGLLWFVGLGLLLFGARASRGNCRRRHGSRSAARWVGSGGVVGRCSTHFDVHVHVQGIHLSI